MSDTSTRLERFIRNWGVKPTALARQAGISRQHLLRLRRGTAEPTRDLMVRLTLAASAMRVRRVFVVEMFELTESEERMHQLLIFAKAILATLPDGASSPEERDGR